MADRKDSKVTGVKPKTISRSRPAPSDVKRKFEDKRHDSHESPKPVEETDVLSADDMLKDDIYGVGIELFPVTVIDEHQSNYSRIDKIVDEVYNQMSIDEEVLDIHVEKPELSYYTVALVWGRLLELKHKQGKTVLTSEEKGYRNAMKEETFTVPQPLYTYLTQMGQVTDKLGKTTQISVPPLPITQVGGYGGYHAEAITLDTHNLYEEVPCLGLYGDVLMALSQDMLQPAVGLRVEIPDGSEVNSNLLGYVPRLNRACPETRQRLAASGITNLVFPEFVENTRFNLNYIKQVSAVIAEIPTFRSERVRIDSTALVGGETQVVLTKPVIGIEDDVNIRETTVVATVPFAETTAKVGAAYLFGYQLYKEPSLNRDPTTAHSRWCCVQASPDVRAPWVIPNEWIGNRNARRALHGGLAFEQFRGIALSQRHRTIDVIRRMVKPKR